METDDPIGESELNGLGCGYSGDEFSLREAQEM